MSATVKDALEEIEEIRETIRWINEKLKNRDDILNEDYLKYIGRIHHWLNLRVNQLKEMEIVVPTKRRHDDE